MARAFIGTSGWNYKGWRESFYAGVPQKKWLHYCARRFTGIEVNGTFYRLQARSTFERWREETPDEFRFAIKANRYLTHNKKLADPTASLVLERERAEGLGEKLAAVLWQMPRSFGKNIERLEAFLKGLDKWSAVRHALEFRHPSWFDNETAEHLRAHRIALCQSDAASWPLWERVTTDLVYIRLHGHVRTYVSAYSDRELDSWAERIRSWLVQGRDVHAYFDNDAQGAAPYDALRLLERISG